MMEKANNDDGDGKERGWSEGEMKKDDRREGEVEGREGRMIGGKVASKRMEREKEI